MLSSTKAAKALFGVAVAAALGFGAAEARASVQNECTIDYATGAIGACQSQSHCEAGCEWYYPENGGAGMCRDGCCVCAY